MRSRLDAINDWVERGRAACYRVAVLSRALGVSTQGLRDYWHERFGGCPKRWLEQLMVFDAMEWLAQGVAIKEVAERAGYKHSTHFARAFKIHAHVSPAAYIHAISLQKRGTLDFGHKLWKMVSLPPFNPPPSSITKSADQDINHSARLSFYENLLPPPGPGGSARRPRPRGRAKPKTALAGK